MLRAMVHVSVCVCDCGGKRKQLDHGDHENCDALHAVTAVVQFSFLSFFFCLHHSLFVAVSFAMLPMLLVALSSTTNRTGNVSSAMEAPEIDGELGPAGLEEEEECDTTR